MADVEIGRLCYRVEGNTWSAYWAPSQYNMEEAVVLGSIAMKFVRHSEERKRAFMDLMQTCFGDVVEEEFGTRPTWSSPTTGV